MKAHVQTFGKAVTEMRGDMRLSIEELAERSGVSLRLLGRIESGTGTGDEFGLEEICKLANGLKVTPYRLMLKWEQLIKKAGEAWW
ncbi:MAG TPA: helix-turn-helix transcriptional regulator [Candidatus Acidoferrales bacterium]|nr:helix-turn-helix transcriptional regulator [Candidatus Acidoferrales bacterium]